MNIDAGIAVYELIKEMAKAYCSECEKAQQDGSVCNICELLAFVDWTNPQP